MCSGKRLNSAEGRAVLHAALRASADRQVLVEGRDLVADVHAALDRMRVFAEQVRSGE